EERGSGEVKFADGLLVGPNGKTGRHAEVLIAPPDSPAANYGFDVTPARLVTGLITERGRCRANEKSILALFPEQAK
ncbi:MAG: S-methyl-5-thioribose-1-phosphate isomerase, partial [Chthoniobacteraceae bacterium]